MPAGLAEKLRKDIRKLTITEGPLAGQPFEIMPWQDEIIEAVERYRQIAFSIPRSNAKTTFCAALAVSSLDPKGSLFVRRGQTIIVASSLQQGRITFEHVKFFMEDQLYEKSGKVKPKWRIIDNTHQIRIEYRETGTHLRVIGSDSKRAHGLAPKVLILDEPAKWVKGGWEMWVALRTAMGKQKDPRLFAIGTKPEDPRHWFNELLETSRTHRFSKVYSATKQDIKDGREFELDVIKKANPSYEYFEPLREEIETSIEEAREEGGTSLTSYRALVLNMGTPEVDRIEMLVEVENWETVVSENPAPREGPVAIAFDFGGSNSMSAIAFYWPVTGRLEAYGALPAEPNLTERGRKDGVGEAYLTMQRRGELTLYPGLDMLSKNGLFLKDHLSRVEDYEWLGVIGDRYGETQAKQAFKEAHYRHQLLEFRPVGKGQAGREDIEAFQSEVNSRSMSVPYSYILEHAILKSRIEYNDNGNPALKRDTVKGKIDVLQAGVLAVGMGYRWKYPAEEDQSEAWDALLDEGSLITRV